MISSFTRPMQILSGLALAIGALATALPTEAQTASASSTSRDRAYYYPHTQDPYRSESAIQGGVENSTIVRPVIINSDINHSTFVNPVIVSPQRSTREYYTREYYTRDHYREYPSRHLYRSEPYSQPYREPYRETRTEAACMAFTQIRVACQQ